MYRNIIQNIKNQSCVGATSGASAVLVHLRCWLVHLLELVPEID